jgi:hypothetical protein
MESAMNSKAAFQSVGVALLLSLCISATHAEDDPVPVEVQLALFAKIISFDRNLKARVGNEIILGIVYENDFRTSLNVKDAFLESMDAFHIKQVAGIPIRCVPLAINSERDFGLTVMRSKVNLLYVTPLRAIDMDEITVVTRARQILSLASVPEYVESGLAIGIGTKGEKPLILINIGAAKAEGSDFNSQLLKLAKVIR